MRLELQHQQIQLTGLRAQYPGGSLRPKRLEGSLRWRLEDQGMLVHKGWDTPCCTPPGQTAPTALVTLWSVQVPHHQTVDLFLSLLLFLL